MNSKVSKMDTLDTSKALFIKALQDKMGIIKYACRKVGISRSTYYNWKKSDPEFQQQVEYVMEEVGDDVEAMLLRNIQEGKESSIIFYCRTKLKHRGYTETIDVESNNPAANILVIPPQAESVEEWKRNFEQYQIDIE